jgi:hypothetical protein
VVRGFERVLAFYQRRGGPLPDPGRDEDCGHGGALVAIIGRRDFSITE